MKEDRDEKTGVVPSGLTFFDPENPPFETHCVCTYLQELEEESERMEGCAPINCRERD